MATGIKTVNVRVPHEQFLATWHEASRRRTETTGDDDFTDGYLGGYLDAVTQTCRWIAAIPMRTALCGGLPRSPVTQRACIATPALIDAEWDAAQLPDQYSSNVATRPGWSDGVRATLGWAWSRQGPPPVELPPHRTGRLEPTAVGPVHGP